MKRPNNITVRVTVNDIITSSYTSNKDCALAKALLRKGFERVYVTPSYVRLEGKYYDLSADDNNKLLLQDGNKDFSWPVKGLVIKLTAS